MSTTSTTSTTSTMSTTTSTSQPSYPARFPRLSRFLFWSWNLVCVVFVFVGLGPSLLYVLLGDAAVGVVPRDFGLFALMLMLLPPLSMVYARFVLRGDPDKLLSLFYAVEVPIVALAMLRIFLIRELTPGLLQVFLTGLLSVAFYAYELLRGPRIAEEEAGRVGLSVRLAGQTLALLGVGYLVALYVPAALLFLVSYVESALHGSKPFAFLVIVTSPLLFFLAMVFVATPPMLLALYRRSFVRVLGNARIYLSPRSVIAIPVLVFVTSVAMFILANRQPHPAVFERLSQLPRSDAERLSLLADSAKLRRGLENAYLAPDRYLGTTERDAPLSMFGPDERRKSVKERAAVALHRVYGWLARPFLFDGQSLQAGQKQAETEYANFFDDSLPRGERDTLLRTRTAIPSREDRDKLRRAETEQKVWLIKQEVRAERHGDWAEIELHEAYWSKTLANEEILYYFSLPESAAITGLWLGQSPSRSQAFAFRVAARLPLSGAPNGKRRAYRDDATVEQVGPRQYRLRVPVSVQDQLWQGEAKAQAVFLWLTYHVLSDGQGFPLPKLRDKRNLYWTAQSERTIEGRPQAGSEWLPERLPGAAPPVAHEAVVDGMRVRVEPSAATPNPTPLPQSRAVAVVLDRSHSMSRVRPEVTAALKALRELPAQNDLDFYLTSAPSRGEPPLRIDEVANLPAAATLFYGGDRLQAMLRQFHELRAQKRYDGIVVLTDDESLDASMERAEPLYLSAPVWVVHLGGRLGAGYHDATLLTIQRSGGSVTTQLSEALTALESAARGQPPGSLLDGYVWTIEPAAPGTAATTDGFSAIAARHLLRMRTRAEGPPTASDLFAMHRLSVEYNLLTQYSSLIGFAANSQMQMKATAQPAAERFDFQVTSGDDSVHGSYEVIATPEPGTWLLLGVVGLYLVHTRRQRRARSHP